MKQPRQIETDRAPAAIGPYSQTMRHGELVFTAGQVGFDPTTGAFVAGGIAEQTERALLNLASVLEAGGASMDTVIKTTVFLRDLADFEAMNEVYARFFRDHRPARSTVQVARLPRDAAVEIEAIAALAR